jgi:phenylacetate-CoA ligase
VFSTAIYKHAPGAIQSGLITLRALTRQLMREGQRFNDTIREIDNSQMLSRDDLRIRQSALLGRLLTAAVLHVPFYRDLKLGQVVADHEPLVAVAHFPIIDKTIVRSATKRFLADNAKRPLFEGSTSGTTGTPLSLLQDLDAINRENAFAWRQLQWAGLRRGDRRAWIRGDLVVPIKSSRPPYWRMNYAENMLMFSSYHLSDVNARAYVDALTKFDPVVIQAYPSSIGFLARWLQTAGISFEARSLKGVVTSSETLDEAVRHLIEQQFGCRVFDWYGQFERVAAIGTCEHGQYHVISDYSYVELLPREADDGEEIVGSGFNNFAMPLIRYRTGDDVRRSALARQCECHREFPLVDAILGRDEDSVLLPDGRSIGRLDHVFKGVEGLLEAQIRQDTVDQLDILLVPSARFNGSVESRLLSNVKERVGESIRINIVIRDHIPRTKSGKLRGVVCNVK